MRTNQYGPFQGNAILFHNHFVPAYSVKQRRNNSKQKRHDYKCMNNIDKNKKKFPTPMRQTTAYGNNFIFEHMFVDFL